MSPPTNDNACPSGTWRLLPWTEIVPRVAPGSTGKNPKATTGATESELSDPDALSKRLDQTQRALCSDIGALERLPVTDEASSQLYRRMAGNLRSRCDKAPVLPKENGAAVLQQALTSWHGQAEQGKEFDALIKDYEQWLGHKADSLRVPVAALLPRNR